MEQFEGTKGDWKLVKKEATKYYPKRNEIQFGDDGECVAEFVSNDYDAKLIASAPDLLKSLQNILKWSAHLPELANEDIEKAKQAINKALK